MDLYVRASMTETSLNRPIYLRALQISDFHDKVPNENNGALAWPEKNTYMYEKSDLVVQQIFRVS